MVLTTPSRTKEEREEWEKTDPEEREKEYLPQKYDALRKVPAYGELVKERFERCMVCYCSQRFEETGINALLYRTFILLLVSGKTDSISTPTLFFPSYPRLLSLSLSLLLLKLFSAAMKAG